MRLNNRRTVRNLICLTALLVCASAPLAAQQGIDLLDADQVLLGGASDVAVTVRAIGTEAPTGVAQATHVRDTLRYDDGGYENFETGTFETLHPVGTGGVVEWAQRFEVPADSAVVNGRVCFYRAENDLSRALDFKVRFYRNDPVSRVDYPGNRSGFAYTVETNIRRADDDLCFLLRGDLVGKTLARGTHWVGIEWNTATRKRLGGDHYTADDPANTDRAGRAVHDTEVRWRRLPVPEGTPIDGWMDGRLNPSQTVAGLKALGIYFTVERTHPPEPDPMPDPDPDPDPGPDPDPDPGMDTSCAGGTCELNGRFRVRTRYVVAGMPGQTAGGSMSGGAGLFTFGGDDPELLVRMVDDCSGSGYWMLYAGAASDADYAIAVRDTMDNTLKWFRARAGGSIRDMAFACGN